MRFSFAKFGLAAFAIWLAIDHPDSQAQELNQELKFKRCQIKHKAVEIDAECAIFARPENPDIPDGKSVNLFVVKLPSSSPTPEADAFTVIQGGPGGSSIDMAIGLRQALDFVRSQRDILVVDQRGTGRSNILQCDVPDEQTQSTLFNREETLKLTRECATKLDHSDLRFYTTSVAVQDLDAVRQAAGYSELTLYGVSYGTRVAQHYLRRFPNHTRAVIIDGVVDVGLNLAGAEIARRSQDAFDNMVNRCNDTPSCFEQFGDIASKFSQLRKRLLEQTVELELPHPLSGKKVNHTVGDADLIAAVRFMPYATESTALLPMLIAQAHDGNYVPLAAHSINVNRSLGQDFATGMHNSIMCAEDVPFVESNAAEGAKDTYFGNTMIDAMSAICEVWPQGPIDRDFRDPFDSDKPVLILSGETDPITPPANGERTANMFSNSKHLVVPSHGHGVVGRGCMPYLIRDFIQNADLSEVTPDCIDRERVTPFFKDTTGPTP